MAHQHRQAAWRGARASWVMVVAACAGFAGFAATGGAYAADAPASKAAPGQPAPAKKQSAKRTVLIVGDSLSAEYGLKRGTGWVALLEQRLSAENISAAVVNASISGDTTAGGKSRLGALLKAHKPSHVVIELGGNDALRGLPLKLTQDNLETMTRQAQAAGARVTLIGMQVPPNFGAEYSERFAATFLDAANATRADVVPFFLKDVADLKDQAAAARLFQADRIHPTAAAHPTMLANVWPTLSRQLK